MLYYPWDIAAFIGDHFLIRVGDQIKQIPILHLFRWSTVQRQEAHKFFEIELICVMLELENFGLKSWLENSVHLNVRATLNDLKYLPSFDAPVVVLRLFLNDQLLLRPFGILFDKLTYLLNEFLAVLVVKGFHDFVFKVFELSKDQVGVRPRSYTRLVLLHVSFFFLTATYAAETKHFSQNY